MTDSVAHFAGRWVDAAGRILIVELRGAEVRVTVLSPETNAPYRRPRLLGRGRTRNLVATLAGRKLIVEAGTIHLGPTYELERDGDELVPSVAIGLYDDFEDDLGVPWAFPLSRYRRVGGP